MKGDSGLEGPRGHKGDPANIRLVTLEAGSTRADFIPPLPTTTYVVLAESSSTYEVTNRASGFFEVSAATNHPRLFVVLCP